MTIKKGGGIFGRNPTFNNVDVDGTLNIGGNAVPDTTTILVDGDIGTSVQGYDADTTKNDVANTFTATQIINASLGIGVSPATVFHAKGSITVATVESTAANGDIQIKGSGTTGYTAIRANAENLLFLTEATQRLRIDSDGLKFGTDSAAANAIDDYEEGTWTPSPTGGSLTINDAKYTKVGRLVTAQADVTATATTSGDWSGLPFNLGGDASADKQAGFVGYQTEESSAVWGILADNTLATFTFRNGSTGKQLTTGSRAVFTIIYYTN